MQINIFCNSALNSEIKKFNKWTANIKHVENIFLKIEALKDISESIDFIFSIILTTQDSIKQLNKEYRKKNNPTDVLTFSYLETDYEYTGDKVKLKLVNNFHNADVNAEIYISLDQAKKQALENNLTIDEELTLLSIHGLLHAIGLDHERSGFEQNFMKKQESKLLEKLNGKFNSK